MIRLIAFESLSPNEPSFCSPHDPFSSHYITDLISELLDPWLLRPQRWRNLLISRSFLPEEATQSTLKHKTALFCARVVLALFTAAGFHWSGSCADREGRKSDVHYRRNLSYLRYREPGMSSGVDLSEGRI